MAESLVLADAVHKYDSPQAEILRLLLEPASWLTLRPREVMPAASSTDGSRAQWTSLWLAAPNDVIEFELSEWTERRDSTQLRFRWVTSDPPDERGIGKVRYRLNYILGSELRGPVSEYWWEHRRAP